MAQLEENMVFRLDRLEQKLEAYRTLHTSELEEIARGLAELRREVEALAKTPAPAPDWLLSNPVRRPRATEAPDRARWPSLLQVSE